VSGFFEITTLPKRVAAPFLMSPRILSFTGSGVSLKARASSGQSSMQLKQTKHSLFRSAA